MNSIKKPPALNPCAAGGVPYIQGVQLVRLEAHIAQLEGAIAELDLLIRNLGLTDRDTSELQDDLRRRMDDLAAAIERRIALLTDGNAVEQHSGASDAAAVRPWRRP